jgi:hypothetical protein
LVIDVDQNKKEKPVTEFELIYLFNEYFNTLFARLNDFLVGLFAMLAASYFVAAKLSKTMAGLVVGLYTLFSVATIVPAIGAAERFLLTSQQVALVASQPGSELAALVSILPNRFLVILAMIILMIAAYAGTILFFFQARKVGNAMA